MRVGEPLNNDRIFNCDQVNSRLRGSTAIVNCADSVSYNAADIHVDPDSTRFTVIDTGLRYSIVTHRLVSIEWQDHVGGALTGAWLGSMTGIGVGAVVLLSGSGSSHGDGAGAGWFLLGAAGLGTISGAAVGAIGGNTQKFRFELDRITESDTAHEQVGGP